MKTILPVSRGFYTIVSEIRSLWERNVLEDNDLNLKEVLHLFVSSKSNLISDPFIWGLRRDYKEEE